MNRQQVVDDLRHQIDVYSWENEKTEQIGVRWSYHEKQRVELAAETLDCNVSTFIRTVCLDAASRLGLGKP